MFPSQGLFKKLPCPQYPHCSRTQCFYSHDAKIHTHAPTDSSATSGKVTQPTQSTSTGSKRKLTNTSVQDLSTSSDPTPTAKRKVISTSKTTVTRSGVDISKDTTTRTTKMSTSTASLSLSSSTSTRPIPSSNFQAPKLENLTVPVKRPAISTAPTPPAVQRRTPVTATASTAAGGPPRIAPDIRARAALKTRQTCANKVYEQFCRIYQPLLGQYPSLATEHAYRQENDIHSKTTNEAGYKQMTMNVLMRLKQRPVARDINDTGIDGEWIDPATKAAATLATPMEKLQPLILSETQRKQMNYPPSLDLLEKGSKKNVQTVGSKKICERCKKEYIVNDMLSEIDQTACTYHYGRMRQTMSFGEKQRVYMCCNESHGSAGCVRGPHVYKDADFAEMHAKIPFVKAPDTSSPERKNLVALDCEMAYTTAGMELIRLTAVDESGQILVDEMCYPSYMVIDLNSRYSGIKTLAEVRNDLKGVRDMLFKYVDKDTILLGHGLENDLQALRLIHDKIIDTAALFPHPKGLPFRFGLRVLATQYLSRFIQESASGHDSFEDAKTCVDLLHAYFKLPRNN